MTVIQRVDVSSWLTEPQAWVALLTLTALDTVLGIDNIIFISVLASKLPEQQRKSARVSGLAAVMITRILLLLSSIWIMRLTTPLFTVFRSDISGSDIILVLGGLFLLANALIGSR